MKLTILLVNVLGFPLWQLAVAWSFVRLPDRLFAGRRSTVSAAEARLYRNVLRVRRWKHLLPSGGVWVGSTFEHRSALRQRAEGHRRFLLEGRRSEAAHWTSLLGTAVFVLWNPLWASLVMASAGVAFSVPCLIVQRYNRAALQRR